MNTMQIAVGTRFTETDSRRWTNGDEKGVHTFTTLNEVTSTDASGFAYKVVEVVAEAGRPTFGTLPTSGSMAWFGWDAALAKGRVEVVR